MKRSAVAGWAVIAAVVIVWDVVMPRLGFETLCSTWRRWGRERPWLRLALASGPSILEHHLAER